MLTYFSLSCLVILVLSKERDLPGLQRSAKKKLNDLTVVGSQEHSFLEAPSFKRYQQQNNEEGNSVRD